MRQIELPWELTERQADIYECPARYLVLVAGRRFGKTILAINWLLSEVVRRGPEALGYYVAPYRVMAKAIAWDTLLKATKGWRVAKNESELTVTLPRGRKVALKGADDPETLEGVGLVAAVCDEFGRMKLDAWQKSLRPALSDKRGRALICGKPRGFNHLKDFYERGQDRAANPDWASWIFTTAQGGFVPTEDIAEARATLPAKVYRQEYEATWESAAGRVYEDFTRSRDGRPWHVVPHAELEREFQRAGRWQFRHTLGAFDWGYTDPGVLLSLGQTGAGDLVAFDEVYAPGVLVDERGWVGTAKAKHKALGYTRMVGDPSEPGFLAAVSAGVGRPGVEPAQNDWREGHRRVATALLPTRHSGGRRPGLLVSDRCTNLIREFESHVFREVRGAQTEEPERGNDHALDALRYGVMALTNGPSVRIL
ncbi:MAG TPA: terminase family protein [Gaiellaceae bacterium]